MDSNEGVWFVDNGGLDVCSGGELGRESGLTSIGWSRGDAYGDLEPGEVGVLLPGRYGEGEGVGEPEGPPMLLENNPCNIGEPSPIDIDLGLPIDMPFCNDGLAKADARRWG